MTTFDVHIDKKRVMAKLKGFEKQLPFAMSLAAHNLAKDVIAKEYEHAKAVFDRPTPLTASKMLRIEPKRPNKRSQLAKVAFIDGANFLDMADLYMGAQIEGGPRPEKAIEYAMRDKNILKEDEYLVPSRTAPLDKYGNIPRGLSAKMMANIGAFHDEYRNTPAEGWTRKRGRKKEYVFGSVQGKGGKPVKGIWQVKGDQWRLIMLVVKGAPKYKARFDFYGVGERAVNKNFEERVNHAVEFAIKTAK